MAKKKSKKKRVISKREWLKGFAIVIGVLITYGMFTEFIYMEDTGGLFRQPNPSLKDFNVVFSTVVLYVVIRFFFLASHWRFRDASLLPVFAYSPLGVYLFLIFFGGTVGISDSFGRVLCLISYAVVSAICAFKPTQSAEQDAAPQI